MLKKLFQRHLIALQPGQPAYFEKACSMPLLCLCLLLFPQFVDKQLHSFRLGIRKRVLAAKVKIIPEPLFILCVAGIRNRPFFEDGLIERQYIIRDKKHYDVERKAVQYAKWNIIQLRKYNQKRQLRQLEFIFFLELFVKY